MRLRLVSSSVAVCAVIATSALGQPPLPMNTMAAGTIGSDDRTDYQFVAPHPGLLTVAVLGAGDNDLTLDLRDEDGVRVTDGYSDNDIMGNVGREQMHVFLPWAGTYRVRVGARASGPAYEVGAAFLAAPGMAHSPDPDARPSMAQALVIGRAVADEVDARKGDYADWFVIKAPKAGTLTVATTGEEGDIALEAYLDGDYSSPDAREDADLDGKSVHESITLDVTAGQSVHVRVVPLSTSSTTAYRITATLK